MHACVLNNWQPCFGGIYLHVLACACPRVHVHVYTCDHVPYMGRVHPGYTAAWAGFTQAIQLHGRGEHVPVDKQCVVCRFEVIKYFVSIMQLITAVLIMVALAHQLVPCHPLASWLVGCMYSLHMYIYIGQCSANSSHTHACTWPCSHLVDTRMSVRWYYIHINSLMKYIN